MNTDLALGDKIGKEVADALGLKHCRMIDIHIEHGSIVTVTAQFYPEVEGTRQWLPILKKYKLEELSNV